MMEQSLKTDQDNVLIYEDISMLNVDHGEYFKTFKEEYIKVLLEKGNSKLNRKNPSPKVCSA